jgi:hypothetical protein
MACPRFEDLLRGGSGTAADHASRCDECRALLEAFYDVDATLDAAFAGIAAPPGLAARARAQAARETRLRRPSPLPEVLDFIGWAAVLTLAAVLLPRFLPVVQAALARLG